MHFIAALFLRSENKLWFNIIAQEDLNKGYVIRRLQILSRPIESNPITKPIKFQALRFR